MKCFYHPEVDAVGVCSQCSKAGCRDCVEDVGEALLCTACLASYQQAHAQEQQQMAEQRQALMNKAKMRIWFGWGAALFGAIISFIVYDNRQAPLPLLLQVPVQAYAMWGFYWGVPRVYSWVKKLLSNVGFELGVSFAAWVMIIAGFCTCLWVVAAVYGCFGGGIYEFYKQNEIAKSHFS